MCSKIVDIFLTAEVNINSKTSNPDFENTDVLVHIQEEDQFGIKSIKKYIATFFTYNNIIEMKTRNYKSGEYLRGKYFFFKNMVIIDKCSKESICDVVNNLIDEGDFNDVFKSI